MPRTKVQTKSKTNAKKVKDEEEEEEEEEAPRRSTRSKPAAKAPAKTTKAPAKTAKASAKTSKAAPAKASKAASKAKGGKSKSNSKKSKDDEEEEEEEEEETSPAKKGKGAKATKSKTQTKVDAKADAKKKGQAVKDKEEEEEDGKIEEETKKDEKPAAKGKRGRGKDQTKDLEKEAEKDTEDGKLVKKKTKLDLDKIEVKIDSYCPMRHDLEILIQDDIIYDAKLNQSNVKANNNKFYFIQALRRKSDPNQFYTFFRWGRVGVPGDSKFQGPFGSADKAIAEYQKKLKEKSVKGDYRVLEMDYTKDTAEEDNQKMVSSLGTSTLKKPIADLVSMIFDTTLAAKQMQKSGYDTQKMPLGKLSKSNIQKGYTVLKELLEAIQEKKSRSVMERLCNDFYSFIPHDVGYTHMSSMILTTEEEVKKKLDLLDSLSNIKATFDLIEQKSDVDNVIDANYQKLKCDIDYVEKGSKEFTMVEQFVDLTKENSRVQILHVFKIEREGEYDRYTKDIPNKMLLWHGSRLANYVGILSQGLRIAPPEAPASGYRFGKGIYLADMFSKSHGYCNSWGSDGVFCIMLCEGAVGNMNELLHDDFNANKLPQGKHSTKALGHMAPSEKNYVEFEEGIKVPLGKPEKTAHQASSCYQNEYIIYDIKQVRIRYLIWMKDG